ncbi:hypothetical protein FRC20_002501, partial [Serendipita sp. 405]
MLDSIGSSCRLEMFDIDLYRVPSDRIHYPWFCGQGQFKSALTMFPDPLCSLLGLDFGMEPDGFNPDCYGMVHDDSSSSDLFSSSSPLASLSSSSSSKHLDSCDIIAIMDPEPMVSIGVIPVTDISKPAKE